MQTTYYKSYRSAPHAGNIIHLSQDLAQRDSLARQPEEERWASETDSLFRPVVLTITPEERRRARQERRAWRLDACASLAVILMTAAFALRMLF